ncbi:ubiquitin carboxyl-terminal hydrolase MINDY-1 isoform X2 [Colius striatus]|uniref:ubiquitin carboxyl-terminal hydrolase MINDY-1 isoform X2 n=1 Tax=Colius striatus TaxID=57412 RepID=UPI002B1DF6D7|nr:ubiquitin carboxyl-terminal hydrolase MINDY-1 isoform X2 [Colius striatus]
MDPQGSQGSDLDLPEAPEGRMEEQHPEQGETLPAPSSGEQTPQLAEEAVSGQVVVAGGQKSLAAQGQAAEPCKEGEEEEDEASHPGLGQSGCATHLLCDEHPRGEAAEAQLGGDGGALLAAPVAAAVAGALEPLSEPPQAQTPSEPPKAQTPPESPKAQAPPEPLQARSPPEPPKAQTPPEPLQAQTPPEPPQAWTPSEPPQAQTPPEPPQARSPPEPPKAQTLPEPPKAQTPPELPQAWTPSEPPQAPTPPEPPQARSPPEPLQAQTPPEPPQAQTPPEPPKAQTLPEPPRAQTLPEPPRAQSPSQGAETDFYCVKWISWKGERTPVVMQSENGPCPLLAIMNILLLQWKVKLPPQKEVVTAEELMAHLGDCILGTQPREPSEGLQLNFQQNINDTMMVIPKLSTGLDVNVRFTGVSDFEYTPECIIFDLLNVPLYHGWLVDPQSPEVVQAVGKLSYNQLVEKIITCKQASDSGLVSEAAAREGELSVFFRNNHFSTMTKHKGHLYLLVTDQGFLQEEGVVWETLHNVDGDSCFCDTEFHLSHAPGKGGATAGPLEPRLQQRQVDQDYLMALSLQQQQGQGPSALSDLELARQLQQEEYQQQQQLPVQGRPQPGSRPATERRQRHKPDLDCTLL